MSKSARKFLAPADLRTREARIAERKRDSCQEAMQALLSPGKARCRDLELESLILEQQDEIDTELDADRDYGQLEVSYLPRVNLGPWTWAHEERTEDDPSHTEYEVAQNLAAVRTWDAEQAAEREIDIRDECAEMLCLALEQSL